MFGLRKKQKTVAEIMAPLTSLADQLVDHRERSLDAHSEHLQKAEDHAQEAYKAGEALSALKKIVP